MIIISGTGLQLTDLPFYDTMDYAIEEELSKLQIKLNTAAKHSRCFKICINSLLKQKVSYDDDVAKKVVFFKDDRELKLILNATEEQPDTNVAPVVVPPKDENFYIETTKPKPQPQVSPEQYATPVITPDTSVTNLVKFHLDELPPEEDTDEKFLELPNVFSDSSLLNEKLKHLEDIISERNSRISDLTKTLDDSYLSQEVQLMAIRDGYEKRLADVSKNVSFLEKRVQDLTVPDDIRKFMKYGSYLTKPRAYVKEGFYDDEIKRYVKPKNRVHFISHAGGEGVDMAGSHILDMLKNGKESIVFVDFSNDLYLHHRLFKNAKNLTSIKLTDNSIPVDEIAVKVGNSHYLPSSLYNDIFLLGMDWISVLNRVNEFAKGRRVVYLFNSISSFNVKHTFSRLSTISRGIIFAESKPSILTNLRMDVKFFPPERVGVVVFRYIDEMKPVIQKFGDAVPVQAFKEVVNWTHIWGDN